MEFLVFLVPVILLVIYLNLRADRPGKNRSGRNDGYAGDLSDIAGDSDSGGGGDGGGGD